jgi:hypothetical protein
MKNKKTSKLEKISKLDKQKIALAGILIAVAVGGFIFLQSSPDAEATTTAVVEAPAVTEAQPEIQPAAPVEAPAESLGASSSGLGR